VRFRILGPLEARDTDGQPLPLGAPKQRALLVALLLHAGKPVSTGRLEAAVWPDRPPRSAAGLLRTYVSGLRSALGLDDQQLVKEPGGYRLSVPPGDLDLDLFDDLSAEGHAALRRADAAQAAHLLAEALALWRGEPAADVPLDGDTGAIVADLAERRLAAEEAWADAQLAIGDGTDLIGRLRGLAARQPLRERACGQLMLALYRAGRKAEALEEYRALRRRMIDELGIEPSPSIQDLHRQILADDAAIAPFSAPAAPSAPAIPRQLPHDIGDFTGRPDQLATMRALLSGQPSGGRPPGDRPGNGRALPVIAVTGAAGAGKTALAVHFSHQLADRFGDGQLFVDLRGHAGTEPMRPAEAQRRFLHALGTDRVPGDIDEATTLYRSVLAGKRLLILLDNAADADQVRPLLPGTPGCLVLVTSRSRLPGLIARDGAAPVTIGPLPGSEAVALLRNILRDDRVDAEPEAATAIAARCVGLPLALRVAAERAAHRPQRALSALAHELAAEQHRLDMLSVGDDESATVRSVFSWSYRNLAPDTARMFRFLGLHPGPDISVPAAAALADRTARDVTRLMEALAGVHLLEENAPGRYGCHSLLRAYAAERAAADETAAEQAAALGRVLTWYLHTADAADQVLTPARRHVELPPPPPGCEPLAFTDYASALAWCDTEHANLVAGIGAAADHGADEIAWKTLVALMSYFEVRKPWSDWIQAAQTGVDAARRTGDIHAEAWTLSALCTPYRSLGRLDEALRCLERALVIRRQTGDSHAEGATLNNIGSVYGDFGKLEQARAWFQRAVDVAIRIGNRHGESIALVNLGETHHLLGEDRKAARCYQRALRIARDGNDLRIEAHSLTGFGDCCLAMGQAAAARVHLGQALAVWRQSGDLHGEAETLYKLGALRDDGDTGQAREHWSRALPIFEKLGDPRADDIRRRLAI
jgi:DNA-binding SARP family transcriptional activator